MRRIPLTTAVSATLFLSGCRPPTIPPTPSAAEYAVYGAYLDHASSTSGGQLSFTVDAQTLNLNRAELQFQHCLPVRMEAVFDGAPAAHLTTSSGNDWLSLEDGRPSHLQPSETLLIFDHPTELFRLSRVAFTLSGYDAYLWVERQRCGFSSTSCEEGTGTLVHGKESGGTWTFEDTFCQTVLAPH